MTSFGTVRAQPDVDDRGRKPSYTRKQFEMARALLLHERVNVGAIAEETGLSRQTVYRIKDDPAGSRRRSSRGGCDRSRDPKVKSSCAMMVGRSTVDDRCCAEAAASMNRAAATVAIIITLRIKNPRGENRHHFDGRRRAMRGIGQRPDACSSLLDNSTRDPHIID